MSQIIITKGKLLKGDKIEIDYLKKEKQDDAAVECAEKSSIPPKESFKAAFDALAVHAALYMEFIPLTKVKDVNNPDADLMKNFNVSGFTIVAEGGDDEGVILTGQKTLKDGKKAGFNTPTLRFNDESENAYPHLEVLQKAIEVCKDEIRKYLNGEHAPDPQQKLDLK